MAPVESLAPESFLEKHCCFDERTAAKRQATRGQFVPIQPIRRVVDAQALPRESDVVTDLLAFLEYYFERGQGLRRMPDEETDDSLQG